MAAKYKHESSIAQLYLMIRALAAAVAATWKAERPRQAGSAMQKFT